MSLATVAAQQTSTSSGSTRTAMSSLSDNFQNFLTLLMTQLQNQDPTSPLDTNEFTSQLVEFASVEQQINTNTSLTKLIEMTQSEQVMQSSAMVGKTVLLDSDHIPLQDGSGSLRFTASSAGVATITVSTDAGTKVLETTVKTGAGVNEWVWDGTDSKGRAVLDGSYKVVVTGTDPTGATEALPFTVTGTVTGVQKNGSTVEVQLGSQTADVSKVQSVLQ